MLEGGKIIDMIDTGVIKDLKFVTHTFSNDANGKMLLGMAFVLSKQYSDKLSQDVTRSVRKRFKEEGKTPIPKHGYTNEEGIYEPDGKNFDLIREAWKMRNEGESLKKIAKYMDDNGYFRKTKTGKVIKMSFKTLSSRVFPDPFYFGILVQANQKVDLREIYNFQPAVNEEDFYEIQKLNRAKIPIVTRRRMAFYPKN